MAEFNVLKWQSDQMRARMEHCTNCEMVCEGYCNLVKKNDEYERIKRIIMDLSTDHAGALYPTWREWQRVNFQYAQGLIKPCAFMPCPFGECSYDWSCTERRIPADIAQKLGIKPITVEE